MATVYYTKDNNGDLWAVADGAAVGTPAGWIDTRNQDIASGWARAFHLNERAVIVNQDEWLKLRNLYLTPLAGGSATTVNVDYAKLAKTIFDEQAKRLQA